MLDILAYTAIVVSATVLTIAFLVGFVLPALPVLWIRGIKATADFVAGVLKVVFVFPIAAILIYLLLVGAGMVVPG